MATQTGNGNGLCRVATAGSGDEVHRVKAMECAKWQWLTVMKCVGELVPDDDSNDGDGNT